MVGKRAPGPGTYESKSTVVGVPSVKYIKLIL